jgi:tetratricopeptide (TPR) repeat protein
MKNRPRVFKKIIASCLLFVCLGLAAKCSAQNFNVLATKATVYPKDVSPDPNSVVCLGPEMKNLAVKFSVIVPDKDAFSRGIELTVEHVDYDMGNNFYYHEPGDYTKKSISCSRISVPHLDFERSSSITYSIKGHSVHTTAIRLTPGSKATLSFSQAEINQLKASLSDLSIEIAGDIRGIVWIGLSGPCASVKTATEAELRKKKEEKRKAEEAKRLAEEKRKEEEEKKKATANNNTNKGKGNNAGGNGTYISPEEQHKIATKKYQDAMKNGDYKTAIKEYDKANALKPDPNYNSVRSSMKILEKQKVENEKALKDLDKNTEELVKNAATILGGLPAPDGGNLALSAGTGIGSKASMEYMVEWGHFVLGFGGSYRRSPAYKCVMYEYRFYQAMGGVVDGAFIPTDSATVRLNVWTGDLKMGFKINLSKKVYLMPLIQGYLGGAQNGQVLGLYPSLALVKKNMFGGSDFGISFDFRFSDKKAGNFRMTDWMSASPADIQYRNYAIISLYFVPGFSKG